MNDYSKPVKIKYESTYNSGMSFGTLGLFMMGAIIVTLIVGFSLSAMYGNSPAEVIQNIQDAWVNRHIPLDKR